MKILYTFLAMVFINTLFSQNKKSSEIRVNQNGSAVNEIFVFAQAEKKIYKNFGIWGFGYYEDNTNIKIQELVLGPCFMNKFLTLGAGYGYEFIEKIPVYSLYTRISFTKYNFTGYYETSESWYWYYAEANHKIKKFLDMGIYTQAGIGTGIQTKIYPSKKSLSSFTVGLGYRTSTLINGNSNILPKFSLNLIL